MGEYKKILYRFYIGISILFISLSITSSCIYAYIDRKDENTTLTSSTINQKEEYGVESSTTSYSYQQQSPEENNLTNYNLEEMVSLDKRDNWYDNGIFSSFFKTNDFSDDTRWSYIGTTADIFGVGEQVGTDYKLVDVYRVDYSTGGKSYYFVPHNEEYGNPPVVYMFMGSNSEKPIRVWQGMQ